MNGCPTAVAELAAFTSSGRRVAVWRIAPATAPRATVVMSPGFSRRMRHLAALARYLVDNGAVVYRFDSLDHVGLSEGDISGFTLSAMYESLESAVCLAQQAEAATSIVLVGASLANRVAIRLAAREGTVTGVVAVAGVVNARATLAQVFSQDLFAMPVTGWPPFVEHEGKQVATRPFGRDCVEQRWLELEDTCAELAAVGCPVVNICGSADDWVLISDVKRAFAEGAGGPRQIIELPFLGHDLGANTVAARTIMQEATRAILDLAGYESASAAFAEPGFQDLVAQALRERRLEARSEARR